MMSTASRSAGVVTRLSLRSRRTVTSTSIRIVNARGATTTAFRGSYLWDSRDDDTCGRRGRVFKAHKTNATRWFSSPSPGEDEGAKSEAAPKAAMDANANANVDANANNANTDSDANVEVDVGKESLEFRAETRQLLDIVTHSLYTDREIFLRELVSNASDALEKMRHLQSTGRVVASGGDDPDAPQIPLQIQVVTDEVNNTLTISDTGIGLSREDMINNLGTIARSGSKAFVQSLAEEGSSSEASSSSTIIGKFGVGFYSAFMVGERVEVRSRPAIQKLEDGSASNDEDLAHVWSSDGTGSFDISRLPSDLRQDRGSSIVIHLKEDYIEYSDENRVESVLKKYSNFVGYPILLNGKRVNTVGAVWAQEPSSVTDEVHSEFYKFACDAFDEPMTRMHFRTDAPLDLKVLLYVPSFHTEKYGMGRMEAGVSLYSRKVLIESKCPDILPEWLRFLRGVVDSEDLPLSLSREKPQDTALMVKIRRVLIRKFLAHLTTMAKKEPKKFRDEFYREYHFFLKEGICQDFDYQEPLSKLLRFETSKSMEAELTSLDEYVSRCRPEQKEIYYLCSPDRNLAMVSPYLETFEEADVEVLFVYSAIDDFVMSNLNEYAGRPLVSAEKGGLDLSSKLKKSVDKDEGKEDDEEKKDEAEKKNETKDGDGDGQGLTVEQSQDLCAWMKETLEQMKHPVEKVVVTRRLRSSPAVVTDHESGSVRRMMKMVDHRGGGSGSSLHADLPKQTVEINPDHPIVVGLYDLKTSSPVLASSIASQVFDNCLVSAGLLDDGRSMIPRLNDLLESLVKSTTMETTPTEKPTVSSTTDETK